MSSSDSDREPSEAKIFLDEYMREYMEGNTPYERWLQMESEHQENSNKPKRRYIHRNREEAHERLMKDYFYENPTWGPDMFRRRFRMNKNLFIRIVNAIEAHDPYFQQKPDGLGRMGFAALQKCTNAVRQLAYGSPADAIDEYLHIAETTGFKCLRHFCRSVIDVFSAYYLRKPTADDQRRLMQLHEQKHGFPGMLGSLDCMHWTWRNCPVAWKGQFTRGDHGVPTIMLEAVASQDLWFWHAFFGVAGSNNDLNVLSQSPLFTDALQGIAPTVPFIVNGRQYAEGYYLTDGIYPEWARFVKSFQYPQDPKRQKFKQMQEAARKDVERAFGVLQARWGIIRAPSRSWYKENIADIMYACIILHNMIVEDEGASASEWVEEQSSSSSNNIASEVSQGVPGGFNAYLRRSASLRDKNKHLELRSDLVDHVWQQFGHQE